jgi:hypothetical protein
VNLKRIEQALEQALEGAFERAIPGRLHPLELYEALWRAVEEGRRSTGAAVIVPNRLTTFLHPEDLAVLAHVPVEGDGGLEQRLEHAARQRGWNFGVSIAACLREDAEAKVGSVRVTARIDEQPIPARLLVESGPVAGDLLELHPGAVLGRSPDAGLRVRDDAASGKHCRFDWTFEGYRVVDQSSTNGTFVNDVRVTDYTLSDGQIITVGRSKLRFSYDFAVLRG